MSVRFDGHGDTACTKDIFHLRLSNGKDGRPVLFTEKTGIGMKKKDFFLNLKTNKAF